MKIRTRSIVKTCTYTVLDTTVHAVIAYIACHCIGKDISMAQAGGIGILIEVVETIFYYIHEIAWEER